MASFALLPASPVRQLQAHTSGRSGKFHDEIMEYSRKQIALVVLGTQHLPDPLQAGGRPLLFVGNHTRFGLYDLPLLVRSNYRTRKQTPLLETLHIQSESLVLAWHACQSCMSCTDSMNLVAVFDTTCHHRLSCTPFAPADHSTADAPPCR